MKEIKEPQKVLIVDDEESILHALELIVKSEGYEVLLACDGEEALKLMGSHPVAAILCDQNLPGMNGTEVLKQAMQICPYATRMMMTGAIDQEVAVHAINNSQIFQFISKPWREGALRQAIRSGIEKYRLTVENMELQKRLVQQHQELAAAHARLAKDLTLGAQIHEVLLTGQPPKDLHKLSIEVKSLPSGSIDGDFFEFFQSDENTLDIVVGDVMGKGLPAALVGTAVKSQLGRIALPFHQIRYFGGKRWFPSLLSPAEILDEVQREINTKLINLGYFTALFYGRFHLQKNCFSYVDCGFAKPLLYRKKLQRCEKLIGENFPMGTLEWDPGREFQVYYETGDLFLFYSDGLTEAKSKTGELFDEERLGSIIASYAESDLKDLIQALQRAVFHHCGKEALDDDLTLIAIRPVPDTRPLALSKRTKFDGTLSALGSVRDFVHEICSCAPGDTQRFSENLQLAINEIFCNSVKHGYQGSSLGEIWIRGDRDASGVRFEIADRGQPFDPLKIEEPCLRGERSEGFGWYIVQQSVDEVIYLPRQNPEGWNYLSVYKAYEREKEQMQLTRLKTSNVLVIGFDVAHLDASQSPQFKERIIQMIQQEEVHQVVFDLENLKFIDSSGLGVFLTTLRYVQQKGGDLKLARMQKPIQALFEMVRMHKLFEIYPHCDDAVSSFSST